MAKNTANKKTDDKKKKNKGGRPKIEWTEIQWQQFDNLCAIQCTQEEICSVMNVTDKTLTRLLNEKHGESFSEVYKRKSASGKMSLRRIQFEIAKGGNAAMAIFLGKQYLGQKDQVETNAPETAINISVSGVTPEDIETDED